MKNRGFEVVIEPMRRTTGEVTMPARGTSGSAGYDFYANDTYVVYPNEVAKIWTDVKAYMKQDEVLLVNIRSSMGGKFVLNNTLGVIDGDYFSNPTNDGNIGIFLKNVSNEIQVVNKGDRIGQGIFMNYLTIDSEIKIDSVRTGGFGSTN